MIFSLKKHVNKILPLWVIICSSIFLTSCVNTRNATYFNDLGNTKTPAQAIPETYIQKNDIISITVSSLNPEATEIYNTSNHTTSGQYDSKVNGYLVNSDGFIQFPVLGDIQVAGLTKDQLRNNI